MNPQSQGYLQELARTGKEVTVIVHPCPCAGRQRITYWHGTVVKEPAYDDLGGFTLKHTAYKGVETPLWPELIVVDGNKQFRLRN